MSDFQRRVNVVARVLEEYRQQINYILTGSDGRVRTWSSGAAAMGGAVPGGAALLNSQGEPLMGAILFDLMPEFVGLEDAFAEIASGEGEGFEIPRVHRTAQTGEDVYYDLRVTRYGETDEVLVIIEDVTEAATLMQGLMQSRNEMALLRTRLAEREKQYRDILEHAGDVVFTANLEGEITYINPRVEALTEYKIEHLIGRRFSSLIPAGHREMVNLMVADQINDQTPETHHEFPIMTKGGSLRWVGQHATLITEEGIVTGIQAIIRDITARKAAEDEAERYRHELEERNRELDAYNHTVAHDLRSPLSVITSYMDLLRLTESDVLSENGLEVVTRVIEAAKRMSEMISNLLMLSNIKDSDEVLTAVEVKPVVAAALERFGPRIDERGIDIQIADHFPKVVAYGPWLEEALANLIGNAIKYIGKDNPTPRIEILCAPQLSRIRIGVRDNGLGIPEEAQGQLFEMFSRFHYNEAPGMGLGLSIVKRIVNKLNGAITVDSSVGKGTTFWIELDASLSE